MKIEKTYTTELTSWSCCVSIIKSDSFKIKLFLSYSFWTQPLGRRRLIKPSSLFIIFSIIMSFGEFSTCVVIIEVMAWNCYYINIARSLTLCRMVKGSLDWLTEYTRERCFKCSSFKVKYVHTFSYIKHTRQRLNMVLLMLIYIHQLSFLRAFRALLFTPFHCEQKC